MKIILWMAFPLAIAGGTLNIVEGKEFLDILWPFLSAVWIVVALIQCRITEILKTIVKLLEARE